MNQYNPQINYDQMMIINDVANQNVEKINEFKNRLKEFEKITTIEEAKNLAKKIMPVTNEINHFRVGGAKCIIVNKTDIFRISLDTAEEFISYDFS